MLEYRYDTQLLIDGHDLDEDKIYKTVCPAASNSVGLYG